MPRTLRAMGGVTMFLAAMLGAYGQFWALLPLLTGVVLGGILLWGMERVVRRTFTPEAVLATRKRGASAEADGKTAPPDNKTWSGKRALLAFALVKYPMVGLLFWGISRHWDERRVMVFLSGFVLLQVVIGLRGLGHYLFPAASRRTDTLAGRAAERRRGGSGPFPGSTSSPQQR